MKLRGIVALALAFLLISEPALAQVNQGTSPLSIPKGGTGGATAAAARTSLGAIGGPGSSTDRTIPTWNGTAGDTLRNNSTVGISASSALTIDAGFGATSVLYMPPNFANSSLMLGNGGTNLVHNAGTFTATITGTDMNVTAMTTGTVPVERLSTATLSGSGVTVGTQIRAFVSGTPGGVGHYTVSPSQTVGSPTAMTAISLQGYYNTTCGLTNFLNATTASYNTICGFEAGEFCTICFADTFFGEAAGIYTIGGSGNSFFGWKAGLGTPGIGHGDYNTAGGYSSGWAAGNAAATFRNTSWGAFSLSCAALAANDVTAIGYNAAGVYCSPGPGLFLGANSAPSLISGAGNFIAGANQAGAGLTTGSNDTVLGNCGGFSGSQSNTVELCDGAGNVAFQYVLGGFISLGSQLNLSSGGTQANLNATGGTSQVLRQNSVGAVITVSKLSSSDLTANGATLQANPGNPTGTTSATGVMMGLGSTCTITPTYSGRIKFEFLLNEANSTVSQTMVTKVVFGTGTAPVNGAAATGTQVANTANVDEGTANFHVNVVNGGIATGLTPGTAYWLDVNLATTGGTVSIINISCNAFEF